MKHPLWVGEAVICRKQKSLSFAMWTADGKLLAFHAIVDQLNAKARFIMPEIAPWAFVLAVPDFNRTADYFRDVLGFRILWQEATDWRLAERNGVRVMLGRCPGAMPPSETGPHNWFGYLSVSDVDAEHAELTERGARCSTPINTAYGMREMVVTTIDGHRIVFGQDNPPRKS